MAEDKNVVEMLGKYLASLSELIKKWNIWDLDLKKLLHALHQVRKDELLGLIEGTHRIEEIYVPKKEKREPEYKVLIDLGEVLVPEDHNDENFMEVFYNKYHAKVFVSPNCSDESVKKTSGIELKAGDKFHVIIYEFISSHLLVSSDDIRKFLHAEGAYLLDAKGVALVYDQKENFIPKSNDYYYSFANSGYFSSFLNFQGGRFVLSRESVDCHHDKGTIFFAFIKEN